MKTLLLCGYRGLDESEPALGLARDTSGETWLDRQIAQLRNSDVICVLAGKQADQQLRECRRIQDVELVFDTNEPNLISNLKAGLFAAPQEACFVLPLEVPVPQRELWDFLRNEHGKVGFGTSYSLLQATAGTLGAPLHLPFHYGFPLLITFSGAKTLQQSPNLESLSDPRLKYLQLPYSPQADVAPASFPL